MGLSGREEQSCTIQSFSSCWTPCFCTYNSQSLRLFSSSLLTPPDAMLTAGSDLWPADTHTRSITRKRLGETPVKRHSIWPLTCRHTHNHTQTTRDTGQTTLDLTSDLHTHNHTQTTRDAGQTTLDLTSDLQTHTHTITRKQLRETLVKRHSIWPLTCRHTHNHTQTTRDTGQTTLDLTSDLQTHTHTQSHANNSERRWSNDTRSDLWPADTHTITRKQLETLVKRHSIWPLTCRHTHTQSHANNSRRRSNDTRSDRWPAHTITRKQLDETPVKRHSIWPLTCTHTITRKRLETPVKRHSIWPLTCRHTHTHNHTQTTQRDAGQTTLDLTADLHTHNHTQTTRDTGQTTLDLTSDLQTHTQSHANNSRHWSNDTRSDLWPADTHNHTQTTRDAVQTTLDLTSDLQTHTHTITRKQLDTPVKRHSIWPLTCRHTHGQSHANNSERRRSNDTRSDLWPADTHTITRKQLETPVKRHSIWPLTCRHTHGQSHANNSTRHRSNDTRSDLWPADTHTITRKQLETPVKRHSIWPLTCRHTHGQSHANNSRDAGQTTLDLTSDLQTHTHTQTTRDTGQTTLDLTCRHTHNHTQTTRDAGQTTLDLTSDLQTHTHTHANNSIRRSNDPRSDLWPEHKPEAFESKHKLWIYNEEMHNQNYLNLKCIWR